MINNEQQTKRKSIESLISSRVSDFEILWRERGKQKRKINSYISNFTYLYAYHVSFFVENYNELQQTVENLFNQVGILLEENLHLEIKRAYQQQQQFISWFEKNNYVMNYLKDGIHRPLRTETIIELLKISKREEAKLKTLVSKDTKIRRRKEYDKLYSLQKRREGGIKPREIYLVDKYKERLQMGLEASEMLAKGYAKKVVSEKLKISRPTLDKILNEKLSSIREVMENHIKLIDYRKGLEYIKDSSVDLLLTDPPYLLELADWDREFDFQEFFNLMNPKIKSGGTALVFCSSKTLSNCIEEMTKHDFNVRRILVWEKTNPTPIKNSYTHALEHIVFAVKGKSNATFNLQPHIKSHSGVFRYSAIEKGRYHFAQKPVSLLCELIELHSNEGDMVLDCFSGSGAISVASKMLNRNSIAYEINETYYEKSVERLNNM